MRPLVARSDPRNAWVTLKVPLRLTAMMSCQSLMTASASPVNALRRLMPALLTRIETGPICSSIVPGDCDAVLAPGDIEHKAFSLAA